MKAKCFLISPEWVKALTVIFPCPPSCRKRCGLVPESSTAESEDLGCVFLSFLFSICDHHPSHGEPVSPALGSTGNPQEAGEHRGTCSPEPLHRHPRTCGKPRRGVKAQRGDVQLGSPRYSNPDLIALRISLLFLILSSQQFRATGLINLVFLILSLPQESVETSSI